MKNNMYKALKSHYESQIDEAVATLDLYFNRSVGIGEHSDLLLELKKYTELLDAADSKLQTLGKYFNSDGTAK
jgi:hypothetical protein